jgi:hypothetical protein
MKWFLAGLALVFASLAGGITAIIVGYRQIIGSYLGETPRSHRSVDGNADARANGAAPSPAPKTELSTAFLGLLQAQRNSASKERQRFLRRSKAKPKLPKARSPQPITTE